MHQDISELIIYEDPHLIVCRKPAGIPTQTSRIGTRDMVSLLKNHLADPASPQKTAGKNGQHRQPYLAVIHRLDQPVEGLLVFAKTPAAARELSRQITSSGFGKYYLAAVRGIPVPSEADLEDNLVRDGRTNTSRVCPPNTPGAKHARLHYRTLETQSDAATPYSVVEIHLDTGRHHQIRVQMAHHGFPLLGDRKYGEDPYSGSHAGQTPFRTLCLCACRLDFHHPSTGKEMHFELSAPSWKKLL
ncbi:RluA family pseudouridine synthase [Mediterraneibacter glycyrrhizinilyticus]|nr:RluA family pseudouridine synthase [Mediterraneibacter glycyrrhizinilyticus]MBM6854381.1 RluA family pseudouridine synthase [Mediterraneibacter glycyrrhizinilyticus]